MNLNKAVEEIATQVLQENINKIIIFFQTEINRLGDIMRSLEEQISGLENVKKQMAERNEELNTRVDNAGGHISLL